MSPDIEGSINPWNLFGERHKKPEWKHDEYETPFAAISSFLELWPGDEQTSECDISERHLRLIETVAGYPEILVGRRPLDMPLHPRSKLAFELSNFLDRIQSPDCNSEWHSLRSFLLHADLKDSSKPKDRPEDSHEIYLHTLMSGIRNGSEYKEDQYPTDTLHEDEYQLLTVLHSKTKKRVERFWPDTDGGLIFHELSTNIELWVNNEYSQNYNRDNYTEHTFRLSKIHKWISKWSGTKMIHPNAWANLFIGTSAFLESIVAKMRSKILDEKRPGSIIVDGGGKITYLSTKSREFEKRWMERQLQNILMKEPAKGKRRIAHPFEKVIEASVKKYGEECESERQEYLRSVGHHSIPNLYREFSDKDDSENGTVKIAKRELFEEYIGPDVIKFFLPPISIDKEDEDNPEWLFDQSMEALDDEANMPWQVNRCMICNNSENFEVVCTECNKLTEHTISNSKWYQCSACGNQKELFSTPWSIMKRSGFVCQFHALMNDIGEMATIRQTTFLKDSGKRTQSSNNLKIHYVLVFDGNSIGRIFTTPLERWEGPNSDYEATRQIWSDYLSKIMNINELFCHNEELDERIHSIKDPQEKGKIHSILNNRRLQALIRKQRRSFVFNAGWWVAIASSIDGKGIIPWIVAGDDTVLASNSDDENVIQELLTTFQENLQIQFPGDPEVPISFAGSVYSRGDLTIRDCYRKASALEEIASDAWKQLVGSKHDLLTESKKEQLEKLKSDDKEKWDLVVKSAKWVSENRKLIGTNPVKSLMLFDHWNDHSSS